MANKKRKKNFAAILLTRSSSEIVPENVDGIRDEWWDIKKGSLVVVKKGTIIEAEVQTPNFRTHTIKVESGTIGRVISRYCFHTENWDCYVNYVSVEWYVPGYDKFMLPRTTSTLVTAQDALDV